MVGGNGLKSGCIFHGDPLLLEYVSVLGGHIMNLVGEVGGFGIQLRTHPYYHGLQVLL